MEKRTHSLIKLIVGFFIFCLLLSVFIVIFNTIFVLISPPKVVSFSPESEAQSISLDSLIKIDFDKPLKRREIQHSILPEAQGEWRFEAPLIKNHLFKTLVFTPAIKFKPNTQYQIKLDNIKGFGLEKSNSFGFTFKTLSLPKIPVSESEDKKNLAVEVPPKLNLAETKPEITMLKISLDWQNHSLSCEAASLKMALTGKGTFISEEEITEKIGYDLTPRKRDVWGDPYKIYVGDINGKMCQTGYGVYWEPVAKVAQEFRSAEAFSNWKIEDLTREIKSDNPVIVWGVLPVESLTDCSWYTSGGKYIKAFKETHVRLAIGFIGPPENPSKIILNDPLAGRLYWRTTYFLKNWEAFGYSGVVIR